MLSLWKARYSNFAPHEVLSPAGLAMFDKGVLLIQPHALDYLQAFRSFIGLPLVVNGSGHTLRGYRSPEENRSCGGKLFSFHMQGLAFDVTAPALSVENLAASALDFGWHGVGAYPSRGFVHVDLRPRLDRLPTTWVEQ